MNRVIEKTDRGIMDILEVLNQMKNKNDVYFTGTFIWLMDTHPPFPGSSIVYDAQKNDFKHWKVDPNETYSLFKDFKPGHYIRERVFSFSTILPYHVIVSSSDWILNLLNKKTSAEEKNKWIDNWVDIYHKNVDIEREHFKSLISFYRPQQALPLF